LSEVDDVGSVALVIFHFDIGSHLHSHVPSSFTLRALYAERLLQSLYADSYLWFSCVQTIICVPTKTGVVELGSTDLVS